MRPSLALIIAGFVVIWLTLDRSATLLGSFVGEYGLIVCAITLTVAVAVAMAIAGTGPTAALAAIGLGRAEGASLGGALGLAALLLAFFPLYAVVTGTPIGLRPDWLWLAIGLFAQGGIAEEVLFRGYFFRQMRARWTFWPAAFAAAVPFVAVHLLLFLTLPAPLAAASLALAVSTAFPLAWLCERAGFSIWPSAIVHGVIQGAIKLVVVPDAALPGLAFAWIASSAVAPWLAFLLQPELKPVGGR